LLPILLLRFVVGKNESATNLQFEPVECHSKAAIDLSTPASAPHLGSEAHLVSPEVVDELLAQHHIERLNCLAACIVCIFVITCVLLHGRAQIKNSIQQI
jgi:hypothetical protein